MGLLRNYFNEDSSPVQSPQRKKAAVMPSKDYDFNLTMGMQKCLGPLRYHSIWMNLKKPAGYSKDRKGPSNNYEKFSLDVLANAALQLKLDDK